MAPPPLSAEALIADGLGVPIGDPDREVSDLSQEFKAKVTIARDVSIAKDDEADIADDPVGYFRVYSDGSTKRFGRRDVSGAGIAHRTLSMPCQWITTAIPRPDITNSGSAELMAILLALQEAHSHLEWANRELNYTLADLVVAVFTDSQSALQRIVYFDKATAPERRSYFARVDLNTLHDIANQAKILIDMGITSPPKQHRISQKSHDLFAKSDYIFSVRFYTLLANNIWIVLLLLPKMGRRDNLISKSILQAVFHDPGEDKRTALARIIAFFTFFQLKLERYRAKEFENLRNDAWELIEDEYRESFRLNDKSGGGLHPVGDLGYSGSTFFTTPNSKYLIKSLPRPSEYRFFAFDLLRPYVEHMASNPNSLLVRITDFLYSPYLTLGSLLGFAPACHIIMENILLGKEASDDSDAWETYDLKPITYFYPERDIADGRLASESTKERLVDKFEDVIRLSDSQRTLLLQTLQSDTKLLEDNNAVDYSLFLVRYPASTAPPSIPPKGTPDPESNPSVPPQWRLGLQSSDGKWIYRLVVLDFFWAKHKTQAKLMTALISSFNLVARKGPMSITTNAVEYRKRFLHMVEGIVVSDLVTVDHVQDAGEGQGPSAN